MVDIITAWNLPSIDTGIGAYPTWGKNRRVHGLGKVGLAVGVGRWGLIGVTE